MIFMSIWRLSYKQFQVLPVFPKFQEFQRTFNLDLRLKFDIKFIQNFEIFKISTQANTVIFFMLSNALDERVREREKSIKIERESFET